MPLKSGRLTPRERAVSAQFVATGSVTEAGRRAGYGDQGDASRALSRPEVQAEVARIALDRISNELLPLALDAHKALLIDKGVPAGARVQAVKLAYDRALGPADAKPDGSKELADMTPEEIDREIKRARAEKAAAAKLIEALEIEHNAPGSNAFD